MECAKAWEDGGDQCYGGGESVEDGDVSVCGDGVEELEGSDAGEAGRWNDFFYVREGGEVVGFEREGVG